MKHLPYFDRMKNDRCSFYIWLIKLDRYSFIFSIYMFIARQMEPYLYLSSMTLFEQLIFLEPQFLPSRNEFRPYGKGLEYFRSVHVTSTNIPLAKASWRTKSEVKDEGSTFCQL